MQRDAEKCRCFWYSLEVVSYYTKKEVQCTNSKFCVASRYTSLLDKVGISIYLNMNNGGYITKIWFFHKLKKPSKFCPHCCSRPNFFKQADTFSRSLWILMKLAQNLRCVHYISFKVNLKFWEKKNNVHFLYFHE